MTTMLRQLSWSLKALIKAFGTVCSYAPVDAQPKHVRFYGEDNSIEGIKGRSPCDLTFV